MVLLPEMGMQALPTGVYGPLPKGILGLLLGKSSSTMQMIFGPPGVIDADFDGEIKMMIHSPNGVSVVKAGQRLAQLILLPTVRTNNQSKKEKRGEDGFGLSDAFWVQIIGPQRPELTLFINGKRFSGLLDTDANVSVVTSSQWSSNWQKTKIITQL